MKSYHEMDPSALDEFSNLFIKALYVLKDAGLNEGQRLVLMGQCWMLWEDAQKSISRSEQLNQARKS